MAQSKRTNRKKKEHPSGDDRYLAIDRTMKIFKHESDALLEVLNTAQETFGYLSEDLLIYISEHLKVPLSRVYGVATFYASFRLAPKGQHEVTLCMGTVCHLKGAGRISEAICEQFNVSPGGTTPDRLFTLQGVNCVGACALAPVMIVDGKYYDGVTVDSALELLRSLPSEEETAEAKPGA